MTEEPLAGSTGEGAAPEEGVAPQPDGFGEGAAETARPTEVEESRPEDDELTVTRMALEERTRDLQRLQAEYLNYKRRVDRDRELLRENATYAALAPITEVLDTIDRAREHGPLEGGFKAVADQLERTVANLGLSKYGAVGDPFDPTIHEALSHIGEDPEVAVTTCKVIAKAGYRIGDRVVRAAQVLVVDPPPEATEEAPTETGWPETSASETGEPGTGEAETDEQETGEPVTGEPVTGEPEES